MQANRASTAFVRVFRLPRTTRADGDLPQPSV